MTTPVSMREPPDGFQEEWDRGLWNVGHVFRWSEVYSAWCDCQHRITVKPGQTLAEAYETAVDEPLWPGDMSVFFTAE